MLVPPFNLIGWFFFDLYFYLYHMRRIVIIIVTAVLFFSCKQNNKALKERLTVADSVAINYFKGDGSMDTVVLVKIIRDKNTLHQLSNLITDELTEEKPGCGYDGSIHFFKDNMVIQDIYFSMHKAGCSQFSFLFNRQRSAGKLSDSAKKLLLNLKQ
jgi:hypothetical protein